MSASALDTLAEILEWNADQYSIDHALAYVLFLESSISALATDYTSAKIVASAPHYRYKVFRKKSTSAHAHLAVFDLTEDSVRVIAIYHTAQNWQDRLGRRP
jgi:plasmid stabilization system protein ParE